MTKTLDLTMRRLLVAARLALMLIATWYGPSKSAAAATEQGLEEALLQNAPAILQRIQKENCRTIGVLKFRITEGNQAPKDNVGPLNLRFAEQLETALAIASKGLFKKVQFVRNASGRAATVKNASHLSKEGRTALFDQKYIPAVGKESLPVDGFVTGVLQVAPDRKDIQANILLVRTTEPALTQIARFSFKTTGAILNELGESFQLRSVNDDPAAEAQRVHERTETEFPLAKHKGASVEIRVFYDQQPVNLEFREGDAWIPQPKTGQVITIRLARLDSSPGDLGAVLKVNGENTLNNKERLRDIDCWRWILSSDAPTRNITGYQIDTEHVEKFQVASSEESKSLEMNYGADVGTISLTVFREAESAEKAEQFPKVTTSDMLAPDLLAIAKADFPDEAELAGPPVTTRGIIKPNGKMVDSKLRVQEHYWDPKPVMSVVIRYYRPEN